jgi:hypothetical protein
MYIPTGWPEASTVSNGGAVPVVATVRVPAFTNALVSGLVQLAASGLLAATGLAAAGGLAAGLAGALATAAGLTAGAVVLAGLAAVVATGAVVGALAGAV